MLYPRWNFASYGINFILDLAVNFDKNLSYASVYLPINPANEMRPPVYIPFCINPRSTLKLDGVVNLSVFVFLRREKAD